MSKLEHRIPPPIIVMIVGLAMWLIARYTPLWAIPQVWRVALATGTFALALCVGGAGFLAFRRAHTTIDPVNLQGASALVTAGIFGVSRNPMYVGLAGLLTAWAVFLAAPWAIAGVVAFLLFIWRFQILPEERVMSAKFGEAYADYRRRVRRWL